MRRKHTRIKRIRHRKAEWFIAAMVLATVLAVVFHSRFKDVLEFEYTHENTSVIADDQLGGKSTAVQSPENASKFTCSIQPSSFHDKYCAIVLLINEDISHGIDLSSYTDVIMRIKFTGPSDVLRIYLRNYDERYSKPNDGFSTKHNLIETSKGFLASEVTVPMSRFYVPSWWSTSHNVPFEEAGLDFSNISMVQIGTGDPLYAGEYTFEIARFALSKQLFPTEEVYLSVIVLWLTLLFTTLGYRIYSKNKELEQQRIDKSKLVSETSELSEQLMRCQLTHVFNRRGLNLKMDEALESFEEKGETFTLVIFDIDHFKHINDKYGHTTGDKVLIELVQLTKSHVRSTDAFARWGGEEFVLIYHTTGLKKTIELANMLREKIHAHLFSEDISITCSFGVSEIREGCSLNTLFNEADTALYEAKDAGRNRVCAHTPLTCNKELSDK